MINRGASCLILLGCCWFTDSCKHAYGLDWTPIIKKYAQTKEDSLYLQSALFLKTHMHSQLIEKEVYYNQETATSKEISFDTVDSYDHWLNILEKQQLSVKRTCVADTIMLSNDLIKKNIEDAVDTWTKLPDSIRCSFTVFLEYVLPYKIVYGYSQNWRLKVRNRFDALALPIQRNDSFGIRLTDTINSNVKKWFVFDIHHSPATWPELVAFRKGDCVAMSRLMCFAGRAYGLPVAIDFCPVWANINGSNHYWNVLLQPHKQPLPFMGGESNPGKYNPFLLFENSSSQGNRNTYKKCAKVFRHTFSAPKKTIRTWVADDMDIPYTLGEDHVIDVTNEYYKVTNITVHTPAYTTQKIVYLSVYNNGQWIPTAWDTINRQKQAVFTNMATKQLYMPAFFTRGIVVPWKYPLIADSSGIHYLQPDKLNRISMKIHFLSSVEQEQQDLYSHVNSMNWNVFAAKQQALSAGQNRSVVTNGKSYSLFYWDERWIMFSTVKGANACAQFIYVPQNCLYKIVATGSNNKERIFTYKNGMQQWW